MMTDVVSYAYGTQGNPYLSRIELLLYVDERFVASYRHATSFPNGSRVEPGTFAKACDALSSGGFPEMQRITELAPGQDPLELGWRRDEWLRGSTLEARKFLTIQVLASTILSVLDSNLARMPPGETTPVAEQHRVDGLA